MCVCAATKVGLHDYHHKEPILSTLSCSSISQLPVARAHKHFKDAAADDAIQDNRLHSREHYDKLPPSPVRSCPQSPLQLSVGSVNLFGNAHCLLQTSPTKTSTRAPSAAHAVAPVKSNLKHGEMIARRIDLTSSNFSAVPDASPSDVASQTYTSTTRTTTASLLAAAARHHQTVAGGSSGRVGAQNQSTWYPWPDCSRAKLDPASQEMLLQTLMNDSIEQRRKTIMSSVSKLQSAPGSSRPAAQSTAAGELYKTMAKAAAPQSMNVSGIGGLTLHSRSGDNKPSTQSLSTSPKASSVSPQQRSLLSSQQPHVALYHLPSQSTQYIPQSVSAATVSRRLSLSMQDLAGQSTQRSMAAATVLSTSPNSYCQLPLVTANSGTGAFTSRSQPLCDVGFPGTGRHPSG